MQRVPWLCYAVLALTCCLCAGTPPVPEWPFHFQVSISRSTSFVGLSTPTVKQLGDMYYQAGEPGNATALILSDISTKRRTQDIISYTAQGDFEAYVIDGPTGTCQMLPTVASLWAVLPPNFVAFYGFTYVMNEYLLQDGVFYFTSRWTGVVNGLAVTYWHNYETNAPARLSWGSTETVIIDFSTNLLATLVDLSAEYRNYLFTVPPMCASAASAPSASSASSASSTPSAVAAAATLQAAPTLRAKPASMETTPAVKNMTGRAWPLQFHVTVAYTNNDMGLPSQKEDNAIPIAQRGVYYYDYLNNREASWWIDLKSGGASKTVIVNGSFYAIQLDTQKCVIPPTAPVNGPLKPAWPTQLEYVDQQLRLRGQTWVTVSHFKFDPFHAGDDNCFHYWQTDTSTEPGVPFRFQGPTLDFSPWIPSLMDYEMFELGLAGVDVDTVFAVPPQSQCFKPTLDEWQQLLASERWVMPPFYSLLQA